MKISIITINFNNLEGLKKTVDSVINQTYHDIEYLIIDGASTDGSVEYIQKMAPHFNQWVSEPDKGIYNAMNKGIDRATGDYLLFLNSGDYLYGNDILSHFTSLNPTEDIVYGNACYIKNGVVQEIRQMPSNLKGETILFRTLNHQCTFLKGKLFREGKRYNESYKILADWVFYNTVVWVDLGSFKHLDFTVSFYDLAGESSIGVGRDLIKVERVRFFQENADVFVPAFISCYQDLKDELGLRTKSRYVRVALSLRSFVLWVKGVFC